MLIMKETLRRTQLFDIAEVVFDEEMIKAVVDIEKRILAIDAELHADLEELLLEQGSAQEALWGINLYPEEEGEDLIEYDSLINIRPRQNNRSRGVEDPQICAKIAEVVSQWII